MLAALPIYLDSEVVQIYVFFRNGKRLGNPEACIKKKAHQCVKPSFILTSGFIGHHALNCRRGKRRQNLLLFFELRNPHQIFPVFLMKPHEVRVDAAVEDFIGDAYRAAPIDKRSAVGFVMTVYRRRLASSFEALKHTLTGRLMRAGGITEEDASQDETSDEVMSGEEVACLVADAPELEVINEKERINDLLRRIAKLGTDSKARRLKVELEACLADGFDSMIVFTQYTDTMEYLRDYLADQMVGMPVASYSGKGGAWRDASGQWVPCSKEEIKRRLRDRQVRLLVCTDAAGEVLN